MLYFHFSISLLLKASNMVKAAQIIPALSRATNIYNRNYPPPLSLSLSLSHTHTHTNTHTHTHMHTHTHACTHSRTLSHWWTPSPLHMHPPLSLTHTHVPSLSHIHTRACTHPRTQTHGWTPSPLHMHTFSLHGRSYYRGRRGSRLVCFWPDHGYTPQKTAGQSHFSHFWSLRLVWF